MAEQVREVMKEEGRAMSELAREALRVYMEEREWRRLQRYGRLRARERGIASEDASPAGSSTGKPRPAALSIFFLFEAPRAGPSPLS